MFQSTSFPTGTNRNAKGEIHLNGKAPLIGVFGIVADKGNISHCGDRKGREKIRHWKRKTLQECEKGRRPCPRTERETFSNVYIYFLLRVMDGKREIIIAPGAKKKRKPPDPFFSFWMLIVMMLAPRRMFALLEVGFLLLW